MHRHQQQDNVCQVWGISVMAESVTCTVCWKQGHFLEQAFKKERMMVMGLPSWDPASLPPASLPMRGSQGWIHEWVGMVSVVGSQASTSCCNRGNTMLSRMLFITQSGRRGIQFSRSSTITEHYSGKQRETQRAIKGCRKEERQCWSLHLSTQKCSYWLRYKS